MCGRWSKRDYVIAKGGVQLIVEISVAVIAVAIVILVIYTIQVLRTLNGTLQAVHKTVEQIENGTLQAVQQTVKQIESDLGAISRQSLSVLQETEQLTADLNRKSQHLDSLFSSVKGIGDGVNQVSTTMVAQAEKHREQLGHLLALTSFGLETWQKLRDIWKRKK